MITSAGLIVPRPGVFVEHIKYLLVVATTLFIKVLGVSFTRPNPSDSELNPDGGPGEIVLHPTELMIPTDSVHILTVVGTPTGRVFMGGKDGHIYELQYQVRNRLLSDGRIF